MYGVDRKQLAILRALHKKNMNDNIKYGFNGGKVITYLPGNYFPRPYTAGAKAFSNLITAESVPDYDDWGWDNYWTCNDWVEWHKALKKKFGKEKADSVWISAWDKQDMFEHNMNWCKYDSGFAHYMSSENLPVGHLLSDVIVGAGDVGGNLIDAAAGTSKVLKIIIPVAIVLASGIFLYWGYKTFVKGKVGK